MTRRFSSAFKRSSMDYFVSQSPNRANNFLTTRLFVGAVIDRRRAIMQAALKRRRHRHHKDHDHDQCNRQLADHSADIAEQTPPTGFTGLDQLLAGDEFARQSTNDRSDEQADDPEK